jgi:hypothetical protein
VPPDLVVLETGGLLAVVGLGGAGDHGPPVPGGVFCLPSCPVGPQLARLASARPPALLPAAAVETVVALGGSVAAGSVAADAAAVQGRREVAEVLDVLVWKKMDMVKHWTNVRSRPKTCWTI